MKAMVFFILIIAVIGGGVFYYFRNIGLGKAADMEPTSYGNYKTADINKDGKISATDKFLIQNHFGCKSGDTCWGTVVGKTVSGDNPIYAYDLDLNKDGIVDQSDVDQVK